MTPPVLVVGVVGLSNAISNAIFECLGGTVASVLLPSSQDLLVALRIYYWVKCSYLPVASIHALRFQTSV